MGVAEPPAMRWPVMRAPLVRAQLWAGSLLASGAVLMASGSAVVGHPPHTTITDLGYRRENGALRATIRVFADDLGRALIGSGPEHGTAATATVDDTAAAAYVRRHFILLAPDGRALPITWGGLRRSGDLLWISLEMPYNAPPEALRLVNRMLFELHGDQINVVRARINTSRQCLLFTAGDDARRLARGG